MRTRNDQDQQEDRELRKWCLDRAIGFSIPYNVERTKLIDMGCGGYLNPPFTVVGKAAEYERYITGSTSG